MANKNTRGISFLWNYGTAIVPIASGNLESYAFLYGCLPKLEGFHLSVKAQETIFSLVHNMQAL